jgi:hypothetical protein
MTSFSPKTYQSQVLESVEAYFKALPHARQQADLRSRLVERVAAA